MQTQQKCWSSCDLESITMCHRSRAARSGLALKRVIYYWCRWVDCWVSAHEENTARWRETKVRASLLAIVLAGFALTSGCDQIMDLVDAQKETPVKFSICTINHSYCFVTAKFKDFESCERYKMIETMYCSSYTPQIVSCIAQPGEPISVAYCAK